ncbi:MAG: hypothetical protein WDW36_004959 [Sanguina aurantia]
MAGSPSLEVVPTLNRYIRGSLSKGESGAFIEYVADIAALRDLDDKAAHEKALAGLARLAMFGHLTPASIQPLLAALGVGGRHPRKDDRGLSRLAQYLVQLSLGDGSAGTPMPPPPPPSGASVHSHSASATASPRQPLAPPLLLPKPVDRYTPEVLSAAWKDLTNDKLPFTKRQAALRSLSALTHASLTSKPDDPTYVGGLFVVLQTLLQRIEEQRAEASNQRGGKKMSTLALYRARMETWGMLRLAFSAARVALSRSGIVRVATKCFMGVGAYDSVCARHALALASLVARDPNGCGVFIKEIGPLLQTNVEECRRTALCGHAQALCPPPKFSRHSANAQSLNLKDPWARCYLARGCAAAIQSGHIAGDLTGRGAVFWEALVAMAAYDPSDMVALTAISAMFGAPQQPGGALRGEFRRPGGPEYEQEAANSSKVYGASWHMVMGQAGSPPGMPDPDSPAATASQDGRDPASKATPMQAALAVAPAPSSSAAPATAAATSAAAAAKAAAVDGSLFGILSRRLLRGLLGRSRAGLASAARTLSHVGESRAWCHAMSGESYGLEGEGVVAALRKMTTVLGLILSDDSLGGVEREAAAEALLWFTDPTNGPALVAPGALLKCAGAGGLTSVDVVRYTFADPWGRSLSGPLLTAIMRRMRCSPSMAPHLLSLGSALAAGSPCGTTSDMLQAMWDAAPGLRSRVRWSCCHRPPITQPPLSTPVEVKVLACSHAAAWEGITCWTAWWLGEHINHVCHEFAWTTAQEAAAAAKKSGGSAAPAAASTGSSSVQLSPCSRVAISAVDGNAMMSVVMNHLQRVMLTGSPQLRSFAALALAKIAVRSNEPFRIQCYSMLSSVQHMAGGDSRSGSRSGGGRDDPLGLAAVVAPALEVLDAMYAGEIVVEAAVVDYGATAITWPAPEMASLTDRHQFLLNSIAAAVCAVPRDLFYPLGPASRLLLQSPEAAAAEEDERSEVREDEKSRAADGDSAGSSEDGTGQEASATAAVANGGGRYARSGSVAPLDASSLADAAAAAFAEGKRAAAAAAASGGGGYGGYGDDGYDRSYYGDYGDEGSGQANGGGGDYYQDQADPLARFDSSGAAAAIQLQWGGSGNNDDSYSHSGGGGAYQGQDGSNSDASFTETRHGTVLFDFEPEGEDEVAVSAGERVRVTHDLGDWLQVLSARGAVGLVPSSYITFEPDTGRSYSLGDASSMSHQDDSYRYGGGDQQQQQQQQPDSYSRVYNNNSEYDDDQQGASRASSAAPPRYDTYNEGAFAAGGSAAAAASFGASFSAGSAAPPQNATYTPPDRSSRDSLDGSGSLRRSPTGRRAGPTARPRPAPGLPRAQQPAERDVAGGGGGQRVALVMYDFAAETEGELAVTAGEQVTLVGEEGGWCTVVRGSDGAVGLVPADYLEMDV